MGDGAALEQALFAIVIAMSAMSAMSRRRAPSRSRLPLSRLGSPRVIDDSALRHGGFATRVLAAAAAVLVASTIAGAERAEASHVFGMQDCTIEFAPGKIYAYPCGPPSGGIELPGIEPPGIELPGIELPRLPDTCRPRPDSFDPNQCVAELAGPAPDPGGLITMPAKCDPASTQFNAVGCLLLLTGDPDPELPGVPPIPPIITLPPVPPLVTVPDSCRFGEGTPPELDACARDLLAGVLAPVCGVLPAQCDSDGDGVSDDVDQCRHQHGYGSQSGCPDSDADGIEDRFDRCDDEPGPATTDGCPDRDGDDIEDRYDTCPDAHGGGRPNGCPDKDGDGIEDRHDACPTEPGPPDNAGCQPAPPTPDESAGDGADPPGSGPADTDGEAPTAANQPSGNDDLHGAPDDMDGLMCSSHDPYRFSLTEDIMEQIGSVSAPTPESAILVFFSQPILVPPVPLSAFTLPTVTSARMSVDATPARGAPRPARLHLSRDGLGGWHVESFAACGDFLDSYGRP